MPIPKTRDPFVNTPLISLGKGPNGLERFWISTYNGSAGAIAALVDEAGGHRIFRFKPPLNGFYSAALEDPDTLWLCGFLHQVVRLRLSTGKHEVFETGAPNALVFQGMILDPATKKLFMAAYPAPKLVAFSFDTQTKKTVKLHEGFSPEHYMRFSFPNGDGTWSAVLHIPGESLLRWDPRAETVTAERFNAALDVHASGGTTYYLAADERGHRYIPGRGWFDPLARRIDPQGPRPAREMTWFTRRGHTVYGVDTADGPGEVGAWNLADGSVHTLCHIPDARAFHVNLSASGKIVAVNMYGVFHRFDAASGALEAARVLPTDAVGHVDCIVRAGKDRLIGTPFITQRFWEVDLKRRHGRDCGRAAPGGGEILQTWYIGGKIYMAAYTGGELMEYDPTKPANFPENPRVVADAPHGMRPVAAADDGRRIFYTCNAPYGKLGSVLTGYDTRTGLASYAENPIPNHEITGLGFDRGLKRLLCGTSYYADCDSCPPVEDRCYMARIHPETWAVEERLQAPAETERVRVCGPLARGQWLCHFHRYGKFKGMPCLGAIDLDPLRLAARIEEPDGLRQIVYAGKPGRFVLWLEKRIELWDMRRPKPLEVLWKNFDGYRIFAQERSVYLVRKKEVVVLENRL
ncbi:MAG: hypothetical protein HY291_13265 [Planctomycetes bacterium]|nr:hypothetical protein [Planctomycetota bacterium]